MAQDLSLQTRLGESGDLQSSSLSQGDPLTKEITKKLTKNLMSKTGNWHAYRATLVQMTIVVHIVASIVTVMLYVLFPSYPIWFAPVVGALATYLVFLIIAAICCTSVATAESANRRSYGMLKMRLGQLEVRLECIQKSHADRISKGEKIEDYCLVAANEARICSEEAYLCLNLHCEGMKWVTGTGYINMWEAVHRFEEALIKIEPLEMVIRGAMNDKLAIQNSTMGNREELLDNLERATSDLAPASTAYFKKEYRTETNVEVLQQLLNAVNNHYASFHGIDINAKKIQKDQENILETQKHAIARMAISEVRRTINSFREGRWEGIITERNQLFTSMSITALATHFLLCITIIIEKPTPIGLLSVMVFYMVGALAGLFGKLYNNASQDTMIDDYGLKQARLIATPLLSGLAGLGGVLITIIFYSTLLTPVPNAHISMVSIFTLDDPRYLLTAAVFGLAPSLVISGLSQRAQRYVSDLQKSKGSSQDNQEN